jgi:hypothetical protein
MHAASQGLFRSYHTGSTRSRKELAKASGETLGLVVVDRF